MWRRIDQTYFLPRMVLNQGEIFGPARPCPCFSGGAHVESCDVFVIFHEWRYPRSGPSPRYRRVNDILQAGASLSSLFRRPSCRLLRNLVLVHRWRCLPFVRRTLRCHVDVPSITEGIFVYRLPLVFIRIFLFFLPAKNCFQRFGGLS